MTELKKKPLFNPEGNLDVRLRRMIGGNTTNLNDFNNMKYAWVSDWYRQAMNNFWIPEEINLSQDVKDYPRLLSAERSAYTQAVLGKGTEHDELIQPPHQLGPEPLLGFLNGLGRLLLEHGFAARCKAQRGALPGQKACPQVGGEQDDGIAEIGLAAHGIGELAVLQDLQQDILDIRVGLFNLVKEHHAVRAAADGFGELTALIVAKVARGRAQQAGRGVLLLILRHIELEQGFLAAEPAGGKGLGEGGLAHAGGPQKEHGPHGAARLPQPGAAAPDGTCHRSHSPALAHDLGYSNPPPINKHNP